MPTTAAVNGLLDGYSARGRRLRAVRALATDALRRSNFAGTHQLARQIIAALDTPDPTTPKE